MVGVNLDIHNKLFIVFVPFLPTTPGRALFAPTIGIVRNSRKKVMYNYSILKKHQKSMLLKLIIVET